MSHMHQKYIASYIWKPLWMGQLWLVQMGFNYCMHDSTDSTGQNTGMQCSKAFMSSIMNGIYPAVYWVLIEGCVVAILQDILPTRYNPKDHVASDLHKRTTSPHDFVPCLFSTTKQCSIKGWPCSLPFTKYRVFNFTRLHANVDLTTWAFKSTNHSGFRE